MANNTIMVNMKFQADTTQAKQAMQSLQNQLTQVMKVTNADLPGAQLSNGLNQASIAAAQLKVHLQSAFNQDTGKLDLSKFDQSLKRSGMTLEKYKVALSAAGPAGQQAFNQLAISVAQAEIPIIRISERMRKFGQTLANTFRWQISSSLLMGVTSTLSSAYGYAQDLNKSLNEIRIVTGYSADQMERFAKQANRAAKALSTTTTEYTNASLIYYQQGLSEAEIEKRTELTIKMANVTGQSAQNVSDQLTAVWNNFYDGTQSLEHYIDVMTALGAATASSSDEISEGLNKFAAVAETVGLSYEYAASALATVTATTRESADIVGNAFKTLFARIQGLKLGETLDDGTTLNKYSTALETVGISIFTQNGQLKDMNTILDEMGSKWNTLSKDQQVALAQTVAGVRQYNQLIALMDNWDEFQVNLNIANTSEGTLQEQADIYAESWEAARDRVTASLEAIYGSLLDDDAFISILNFFADLLENINDVIDSVGGLKGVLMLLGTAFLTLGKNAVASGMSSIGHTFMGFTAKGRQKLNELREEGLNQAVSQYDNSTPTGAMQQSVVKDRIRLEQDYQQAVAGASAEHQEMARIIKDSVAAEAELVEKEIERARLAEETADKAKKGFAHTYLQKADSKQKTAYNDYITGMTQQGAASSLMDRVLVTQEQAFQDPLNKVFQDGTTDDESLAKASTAAQEIRTRLEEIGIGSEQAEQALKDMYGPDVVEALKNYRNEIIKTQEEIKELQSLDEKDREGKIKTPSGLTEQKDKNRLIELERKKAKGNLKVDKNVNEEKELADLRVKANNKVVNSSKAVEDAYNKQETAVLNNKKVVKEAIKGQAGAAAALQETGNKAEQCGAQMDESAGAVGHFNNKVKETPNAMNQAMTSTITFSQRLVGFASAAMSAAMAIQAIQSLGAIWSDEDASLGDQILQTMMSLGMVIPMVTSALNRKNIAQIFGITLTMEEGVVTGVNSTNKLVNATATLIQKAAHDSLNVTMATTIAMYALLAIGIVAVIGVIWLISKAFESEATAAESAAESLEKSKKAAAGLTEELKETKQQANELVSAFDKFKEIQDSLKNLTEGTSEWKKTLAESQEALRELLKLNPELRNLYIDGEKAIDFDSLTGLYTAHKNLEYVIDDINTRKVLTASMAEAASQIGVQDAELLYKNIVSQENAQKDIFTRKFFTKFAGSTNGLGQSTGTITIGNTTYDYMSPDGIDTRITMDTGATNDKSDDQYVYLSKVNEYFSYLRSVYANNAEDIKSLEDFDRIYNEESSMPESFAAAIEEGIFTQDFVDNMLTAFKSELGQMLSDAYSGVEKSTMEYSEHMISYANQLASDMLVTSQDFINASAAQRQAATIMLSKGIQQDLATLSGAINAGNDEWTEGEGGGQVVEWLSAAMKQSISWDFDMSIDENLVSNPAIAKYYAENYLGLTPSEIGYNEDNNTITIDDQEVTGQEIVYTVVSEFLTQSHLDQIPIVMGEVFKDELLAAGISGNFSELTEEQINSISTGVDGNRAFTEDYEAKLKTAGLTSEEIADREKALQGYNAELVKTQLLQKQQAEGEALIAQAAEEFDFDPKVLTNYAKSLQATNQKYKDNYKLASQAAVANAKFAKGLEQLSELVSDKIDLLKNWNSENYETIEVASEAASALSLMFGVDVSTNFVKELAESGDLEKLISGTEEASKTFQELELAAAKDYVASLGLSDGWEEAFNAALTKLSELEASSDIGASISLEDTGYIDQLNTMLKEGTITAEQVQKAFGAIGWSPNITYGTKEGPETTTNGTYTLTKPNLDKPGETITETYEYKNVSRSTVSYPIIGDNDGKGNGTGQNVATYVGNKSSSNFSAGKKSGGGGGSKQEKKDNSEIERYHEVKEVINDLSREYDNLAEAKDRAFGLDRLSLMEDELKATEKMIEAQKQYLEEIEQYRKADKEKLAEYGASFDEMGRITNYDEMYEVNIKAYNEAVDKVNAGSMTDEQFEEYEKEFDEFVDDIAQYEETLNLLEDEETNLLNLQNQLFDAKIASITYKVELDTRLADNEIAYLEYQFENLSDSIDDTALSLVNLGKQTEQNLKKVESYQTGIKEMLSLSGFSDQDIETILNGTEDISTILQSKILTDEQISTLEEYRDALMDVNTQMSEMRKQVHEELIAAFEEMNEEMNREVEAIDHFSDMLQSYRDIIDLVGKDNMGISNAMLQEMSRANVENASAALRSQKAILEANKSALAEAEASLAKAREANQEEDIKLWEETVRTLSETVTSGEEELMSRWQSALQAAADAFSDAVDQVMEDFEKAMTGVVGGFDALQEKYNQQKEINDRYLDDYQKIYELSKLNRDITKSIDDTDNIRAKTRLRDIQEEINALQESNAEMTQYEVNELRARYELRLAEIALEEAQNAKNQVRMSRDAEGNWSYVYTANQENVDNAMQNYEDKLYAYQTLTQERAEEIEEQILALPKEFSEAIQEIMMDLALTEEEKEQKIFDTRKYYEDKYNYLLGQISISLNDAKRLYENDWQAFSQATGYKISDAEEWQDKFDETILAQLTGYTNIEEAQAKFNTATNNMFSDLLSAYKQYKIDTDNIMSEVAIDAEVFTEKITNGTQEAADSIKSLADAAAEGFGGLVDWVNCYANEYGTEIQKYISENDKMIASINSILEKLGKVPSALSQAEAAARQAVEEAQAKEAEIDTIVSSGGGSGGGSSGWIPTGDPTEPPVQEPETKYWRVMYDADGKDKNQATPIVYKTGKYLNAIDALNAAREKYMSQRINSGISRQQAEQDWLKARAAGFYIPEQYTFSPAGGSGSGINSENNRKEISAFASGGYTGEWGAEGRIAMLHQKELVLNADDTTNFLSAIKIIRDISRVIDLRATAQQSALSAMTSSTVAPMAQILQQEVTIHAEFPNATQRTEIEAAFDTLLNRASQFANRKNQ